jgi:N-succinyl-L-ornithine transcarbamylase
MRNFISVDDAGNIEELVNKALSYKSNPFMNKGLGANKRIGCIFLNPSMRTRLSTPDRCTKPGHGTSSI